MGFRVVPKATNKIDMGDGDFIEVKAGLTKGDFRKVLERLPDDFKGDADFNPLEADQFTVGIFDALVVSWTAKDEDGNPVPATIDGYMNVLDRATASAVDLALFEYFNNLDLKEEDRNKSGKTSK
jgi:hypothetical protein